MKKKRTAQFGSFSLQLVFGSAAVCSLITGTLLAFFHPETPAKASQRMLTFGERVAYQRAIEEVYWRHRIWPKENSKPKLSLDEVMSAQQIERKVEDYLRHAQTLEDYWQRPITPDELQAEMERIASYTKQPGMLRELFEALHNDPFVIAECLARPVLEERLIANPPVPAGLSTAPRSLFAADTAASTENGINAMNLNKTTYTLPAITNPSGSCADDTWTTISTTNAPARRASHTAVWTGSEMIVWGGFGGTYLNTGGRYNPSTNSWTATSTINAPAPRGGNTAVWTGSEMIVWGGDDGFSVNTGGKYNPATDTWTATNTATAPLGRIFHTAVWDGSEMIVWGGWNEIELGTGGRYNPGTDAWTATSTNNAPTARYDHTAVWTGNEMIVWGGRNAGNYFNTGGKYNPGTDNWAVTSTTNAPVARFGHAAVWTGSDMIVWGGTNMQKQFNTGGRYNPGTDNWMATTTSNGPEQRAYHTAVWSGSEMIVWGGITDVGPFYLNTGGRYCSAAPSPTATPTATPAESCLVKEMSLCNSAVSAPPTDFIVEMSCPVDQVQPSGFRVNNIGANSFIVSKNTITFHFNTSPAVPGLNTIHILNDAITCCIRPVNEFTCTFTYVADTPTPTPTASPTSTPSPRSTPVTRLRPTPHPRP